ncbi:hypothetical protein AVEN_220797-1 [Araneus ventricosus]|uniref:Gustatory receptor n=1 Tax=Araneus ventricosus TaxID=182803 RepID=A0A4Y2VXC5_ARAVE|nr:hypothetical protein AVEN_220797-1 [Araneus ventricosus]
MLLWYSMLYRKKNVQRLLDSIKSNSKISVNRISKKCTLLTNLCLLSISIYFVFLAAVNAFLLYEMSSVIWTYGCGIQSNIVRTFVDFICTYAYYSIYMELPLFMALSISVLIHQYGVLLLEYKKDLNSPNFTRTLVTYSKIVKVYNKVEEDVIFLKDVLSTPLFFSFLLSIFHLYTALSSIFQLEIPLHSVMELCNNAITGSAVLSSLAYFSCKIPDYLSEIQTTIGSLIDKHEFKHNNAVKDLLILYRVEKKETIYLSACGAIYFKRGFLLSVYGALFTYGTLISGLKIINSFASP